MNQCITLFFFLRQCSYITYTSVGYTFYKLCSELEREIVVFFFSISQFVDCNDLISEIDEFGEKKCTKNST